MSVTHKTHKAQPVKVKAVGLVRRPVLAYTKEVDASANASKDEVLRFRVHADQKEYWMKAMKELGVDDFSSYARSAIERAVTQDLRSLDPKWQAFMKMIQPKAKEILDVELSDDVKDRVENDDEVYKVLQKRRSRK